MRGIIARPELNGLRGVVVTAPDDRGRVGVQLEGEAKPLSLKSSSLDVVSAAESWVKLARLGYQFVAGPSGDPDDLVLRQLADKAVGFTWRGQEDYDAVGAAVTAHMQHLLASPLCGLEAVRLPEGVTVWASPGLQAHAGPVLLLVAGMAPGGAAGVWGRSLCINESTLQVRLRVRARVRVRAFPNPAPCPLASTSPPCRARCSHASGARKKKAGPCWWPTPRMAPPPSGIYT